MREYFSEVVVVVEGFISHYILSTSTFIVIHANLVILAAFNTYYQCIVGESWTLRWLRSLLDKMDASNKSRLVLSC